MKAAKSDPVVVDVCRKHNRSEQSYYRWQAKLGGMTVSEAKRLKEVERENAELKRMATDQALDIGMPKGVSAPTFLGLISTVVYY